MPARTTMASGLSHYRDGAAVATTRSTAPSRAAPADHMGRRRLVPRPTHAYRVAAYDDAAIFSVSSAPASATTASVPDKTADHTGHAYRHRTSHDQFGSVECQRRQPWRAGITSCIATGAMGARGDHRIHRSWPHATRRMSIPLPPRTPPAIAANPHRRSPSPHATPGHHRSHEAVECRRYC